MLKSSFLSCNLVTKAINLQIKFLIFFRAIIEIEIFPLEKPKETKN